MLHAEQSSSTSSGMLSCRALCSVASNSIENCAWDWTRGHLCSPRYGTCLRSVHAPRLRVSGAYRCQVVARALLAALSQVDSQNKELKRDWKDLKSICPEKQI